MNLYKELRKLKRIEPNETFAKRSKFLILNCPQIAQNPWATRPVLDWTAIFNIAFTFGVVVLLIVLTQSGSKNLALAGLVDENLQEEMAFLTKGIEEPTLTYYTNSNKAVSYALDEIEKDKTNHLNERVLEKEIKELRIT